LPFDKRGQGVKRMRNAEFRLRLRIGARFGAQVRNVE